MARLLIHVEGQTEEQFVNKVLRNYLVANGFHSVDARIVGDARDRQRGGIRPWPSVRRNIMNHLIKDPGCVATTMVDYYGMPRKGDGAWPGREDAMSHKTAPEKAQCVQDAIREDLASHMGKRFDSDRFVPFVVMHEFEALLFSDCAAFSRGIDRADLEEKFQSIRDAFANPEEINDSPETAPSKRIEQLIRNYQKPTLGVQAALEIGLPAIRTECPHFNNWLSELESRI